MKALRTMERWMRYPTGVICAYEAVAIFTNRVPPITVFCSHHKRWVTPLVTAITAFHLVAYKAMEEKIR